MREAIGYDAVLGAMKRQIKTEIDWSEIEELGTIGIDEIALKKGHSNYVAIVTARSSNGQSRVLTVLPDRKKECSGIFEGDTRTFTSDN